MKAIIINIETTFHHENLDKEIFMDIPPGLEVNNNQKLFLRKIIYGLAQNTREFNKKLIEV
jgi:hypothetical protein